MAGRVIGDAYVRIRALSDKLEDDIQKALDGSDASSKALGDKISKSLRESVEDGLRDISNTIEDSLKDVDTDILIDIDVDTSEIDRQIGLIDTKDKTILVDVEIDPASLHNVKEKFKDLKDEVEDNEIEVHPSVSMPWYQRVAVRLAYLARPRSVSFSPEVNQAAFTKVAVAFEALSGARLLTSTLSNLTDGLANLDKSIPKIALVSEGIAGLGALLLTAASNVVTLGAGLVEATFAGLALPGIFAGMAVGLGATIAVFKDFGSQLPGIGRQFSALQNSMSDSFWGKVRGPMQSMIDTLFPEFSGGVKNITDDLGGYFAGLATAFETQLGGTLTPMFDNLGTSIRLSGNYTESIVGIIKTLGETGSEYLPRLAVWFGTIIDRFDDWLDRSRDSGALNGWIETGIQRLSELGDILKNTGSILGGIAKATQAAGGSQLGMLADSLGRVAEIVNKEPFQSNLVRVLQSAHLAMNQLAKVSGPAVSKFFENFSGVLVGVLSDVGVTLGELVKGVATALSTDGFDNGLLDLFRGINSAVSELAPMWGPIGDGIGAILGLVGDLAVNFAPLLSTLLIAVSDLAVTLAPSISAISTALAGVLGNVLEPLLSAVTSIIEFFVGLVAPILSTEAGVVAVGIAILVLAASMGTLKTVLGAISAYNTFPFVKILADAILGPKIAAVATAVSNLQIAVASGTAGSNSKLATLVTNLGKLGPAAIGITAAVVAATAMLTVVGNLGVKAPEVEALTDRLLQLNTGLGTINTSLDSMFQGKESGWSWLAAPIDGSDLNNLATDVEGLADAVGYLDQWADADVMGRLFNNGDAFGGLGAHSAAMNQSKESMEAFDQAMANVVKSGNPEHIAAAQKYIRESMEEAGKSYEDALVYMPNYGKALEDNAFQVEAAAVAQQVANEKTVASFLAYQSALSEVGTDMPNMLSAIQEGSLAMFDFGAEIGNTELSLEGWIGSLEDQVAAQASWADNMITLTEKGVSNGILLELAKLPDGAKRVAELVDATPEQIERLNKTFEDGMAGVVDNASGKFSELSAKVATQLAGINLNDIDPSGKLAATFTELGYNVSGGFVTGVGTANPGGGAGLVFGNINLNDLDPSGRLVAMFEDLGYTVSNGFITGVREGGGNGESLRAKIEGILDSAAPTNITPTLKAALDAYGIQLPAQIGVAIDGTGDELVLDKLNAKLSGMDLSALPDDLEAALAGQGALFLPGVTSGIPANALGLAERLNIALNASLPKEISAEMAAALEATGATLPAHITVGVGKDDGNLANSLSTFLANVPIPTPSADQIAGLNAAGFDFVNGFVVGIDGAAGNVGTSGEDLANKALNAVKAHLGIESPSKKMKELGEFSVQGFVEGLGSTDGVGTAGNTLAQALLNAFTTTGPSLVTTGASLVGSLIAGVTSQTGAGSTAGSTVGSAVTAGVKSVSALSEGTQLGASAVKGVNSKLGEALTAGTSVATNAKTGLGSQNATDPGSNIGKSFAAGLATTAKVAEIGSVAIAIMTRAGLGSVDAAPSGVAIGTSFARGLAGVASTVAGISASVARSAVSSLDDYAPSAASSGASIGNSFARGLRDSVAGVRAAAQAVAAAARAQLPNSPAKEGPFSGSGWGGWGESIAEELADGMVAGRGSVRSASENMLGAIGLLNPSMASNSLYTSASSASSLPSALDSSSTGIISSGNTGATTIIVNADIKDLAGVADLAEFIEMTSVWSKQGYSPS